MSPIQSGPGGSTTLSELVPEHSPLVGSTGFPSKPNGYGLTSVQHGSPVEGDDVAVDVVVGAHCNVAARTGRAFIVVNPTIRTKMVI